MQLKTEAATQDVVPQITLCACFFQRGFKPFVGLEDLAVDVVVADRDAHRIGSDDHAFDDDVRVELQDVTVLAGTRLALVGIAHQIFLAGERAGHEAPLKARREARAAAATQTGFLDSGNDLILRQALVTVLAQDATQRLIAATRFVVLDAPVAAIQARIDLGVDVAVVETGLNTCGLELGEYLGCRGHHWPSAARRPSTSWSSLSLSMKLHIVRSFTSITGASAQAPRHSHCCRVNRPSGVVSPIDTPSFFSR